MIESLADIEALSIRCRSEQSKAYISESISCYRAGAYRAAIVSTWIAVVFDLIDKIRELSLAGDASAKALELQYETYVAQIEQGSPQGVKSALEFERDILDTSKDKLQFFDPQQFIDLTRLREDRHRCAHPSFQQVGVPYLPSAEQARLHIRNAIVHVLSQPPVQGKVALAELKTMVGSAYFPQETGKAVHQLKSSSLNGASDALVRGFVDQLVFGFLTQDDSLFYKKQVIAALNAAFEMYPGSVEERLRKQLNKSIRDVSDDYFSGAACLVANLSPAWVVLDDASKDKISNFINAGPVNEVIAGLSALSNIDELKPAVEARVNNLEFDDLAEAISLSLGALAKDRALYFLSEVGSWDRANTVFSKVALPIFDDLTAEDIRRVIRMPTENDSDLPGSHGYGLFIKKVRESNLIDGVELDQMLQENGAAYLVPQDENA